MNKQPLKKQLELDSTKAKPKSGYGGPRPNSGRKPGTLNEKNRIIATKAIQSGITPLEVMIEAMRKVYDEQGAVEATPFAEKAAPFVHARISSMELKGDLAIKTVSDDDLENRIKMQLALLKGHL